MWTDGSNTSRPVAVHTSPQADDYSFDDHGNHYSYDDDSDEVGSLNPFLGIYIASVFFGACFFICLRERNLRNEEAETRRNTPDNTNLQEGDRIRSMTPARREEYVSSMLNKMKFEATKHETARKDDTSSSIETDLDEEMAVDVSVRKCAICLETFNPSDTVSTSNNEDCLHVFHRHCAREWLLKNEDCPCCRRPYLSFDNVEL